MIKLISIFLISFVCINSTAQDSLRYDKTSKSVYQNDKMLDSPELTSIIQPNKAAFKHLSATTDSRIGSNVFIGLSSFPIGFTLGYFLIAQKLPPIMAGVGLGLLGTGILLHFRSKSQFRKTLEVYNSDLSLTSMNRTSFEFGLSLNQNGLGLNFTF